MSASVTKKLPIWCERALRYYVGDKSAYSNVPEDEKAYNTLNVLFFDGLDSERARAREGKKLNGEFLSRDRQTLSLCADLLSALNCGGMGKDDWQTVYRVTRRVDVDQMREKGMTVSFTSTSKGGFLEAYTDKDQLILLEIRLAPHAPRADMAELLENYVKPDEKEVLLPPWLPVKLEEVPLSAEEAAIRDRNGNPPTAKYIVTTESAIKYDVGDDSATMADWTGAAAGQRVYEALTKREEPAAEDVSAYVAWKQNFRKRVSMAMTMPEHSVKLKDALNAELEACQYITEKCYSIDNFFGSDTSVAEKWIMKLLGIEEVSSFAKRMTGENDEDGKKGKKGLSSERLVHTVSTYLLGCYIQKKLLLRFDRLPRIFSKKTTGSAFGFFWSMVCLCHDLGYAFENDYKNKDEFAKKRAKMLTADGRRELLEITSDFLSLPDGLNSLGFSDDDGELKKWVEDSIDVVARYNKFRVITHKTIDHGIAGGLILFDYAMSIARPEKHMEKRDPAVAATKEPQTGYVNANRGHSRFLLCSLMIALTVARHNIWFKNVNRDEPDDIQFYKDNKLNDLIIQSEDQLLSMKNPLDQMLYMLEYMDTIDPIKAFYTRPLERGEGDSDLRKKFLLDDVYIQCIHRDKGWQSIEFSLGASSFMSDGKAVADYIDGICTIDNWMQVDEVIKCGHSAVSLAFPVTKRESRTYPYDISDEEIMALCLYQGSGDSVRPGLFYQIPNAYQTFNLLMMEGLEGEKVRIGVEKQRPNGVYILNWRRTLGIFKSVFTAQCKYYKSMREWPEELKRCDRGINTKMMLDKRRTIAFTSTSKKAFLEMFARGKEENTYLLCTLNERVPIADFQEILGNDYAFVEEAEVLLPPFLGIESNTQTAEKDYAIVFGHMTIPEVQEEDGAALEAILDNNREVAAKALDRFMDEPETVLTAEPGKYAAYLNWKKAFQKLVTWELYRIWKEYATRN